MPRKGRANCLGRYYYYIAKLIITQTKETVMRLSARNILKGKVIALTRGATTTHVKVEIIEGMVITASITNEAIDDLGLMVGMEAAAIIKASDVMIGVEL